MKIRLLWDFYGPNAERTAQHFERHLKEFLLNHELSVATGCQALGENHWCASCDPPDVPSAMLESQPADDTTQVSRATSMNVADQIGRALRPQRVETI